MKHPILLFCIFATLTATTLAQGGSIPGSLNARVWNIHHELSKGYLYEIGDSGLLLSWEKRLPHIHDTTKSSGQRSFAYQDIDIVSTYRRGSVWRSAGLGLVIGAFTGATAGFLSGDDPKDQLFALSASEKALAVGLFGGFVGTITGLIVGVAGHRTFYIHGRKEKFDKMSKRLAVRLGN